MPDLSQIIQVGTTHAWFYLPVAVILGALHALEPGHAKSLMAAYIVSIRGTPGQAAVLGLSAAVGHTIIVWALAIAALLLGQSMIAEEAEPWLTLLSGILVTLLALRINTTNTTTIRVIRTTTLIRGSRAKRMKPVQPISYGLVSVAACCPVQPRLRSC